MRAAGRYLPALALALAHTIVAVDWPTVDCGALLLDVNHENSTSTQLRQSALASLREALMSRGFFYCANCDSLMDAEYIASVYDYSRKAHSLSAEVKRKHARPKGAYTGEDIGVDELAYEAGTKSIVRAWDFARENNSFVATEAASASDKYPDGAVLSPRFDEFVGELFDRQQRLAVALLEAIAEMLGLARDTFSRHMVDGVELGTTRLLHYPKLGGDDEAMAAAAAQAQVGIGAHTDFEAFTLMHQSAPGLQLRAVGDEAPWEDAPVRPSEFVVIIGDVLERMTNGVLRATPHRVLPSLAQERFAIIRFNALRGDTAVGPLSPFVTPDRPKAYSDTTMDEIMRVTIGNLEAGKGAWDAERDRSTTATYDYSNPVSPVKTEL